MTQDEALFRLKDLAFNKFSLELIDDNWHGLVKALFKAISNDKNPVFRLQRKRDKLKEDYADISKPYVRGEMYGSEGGGTPLNSWHENAEENLHIERQLILEEISAIAIQQRILEEQLKDEFEAFETVCYSLKNTSESETLILFYLEKKTTTEIAIDLGYSIRSTETYIYRGIQKISKMIKNAKCSSLS